MATAASSWEATASGTTTSACGSPSSSSLSPEEAQQQHQRPLRQRTLSSLSLGLSRSSDTSKSTQITAEATSSCVSASSFSSSSDDEEDLRVRPLYAPTRSETAQMALTSLQDRLQDRCSDLCLESMKESFDKDLLTRFYNELMIPNFPLEEERDALEDWMLCLDPSLCEEEDDLGPSMDVLILYNNNTIIAGIAFEYYPKAQAGLLSYMVVNTNFRRLGILATLHPVFCEALQALHETTSGVTASPIAAILAETNTTTAGDVSPQVARKRHEILYRLGYRLLQFPYVQPPLATNVESFDDIMLLVYVGNNEEPKRSGDNTEALLGLEEGPAQSDNTTTTTTSIDTQVLYDYVLDFYHSVFGVESLDFQDHWYYQLVSWYANKYPVTKIQESLPWEDVTPLMRSIMDQECLIQLESGDDDE